MVTQDILDPVYDPRAVEPAIYEQWEQSGAFESKPDDRSPENTYCIVIPPPNVTGALHLGHALNNTLQDILVRYHRMMGFNTLWQPGTDHAGIATQAVVERRIRELEGKSRHDLGREELVRRIWEWKGEYEKRILNQLKLMGCSCDWKRNRFTLDDGLAKAVRHQFFKLFKDGLIFRGKRLVNWDTELQTAVANDEVYHEAVKGHFWHFKYPVIAPEPQASACAVATGAEPHASACAAAQESRALPSLSNPDLTQGATLLTWTTYGTWLPGDQQGFVSRVDREDGSHFLRNLPGEPYDEGDPEIREAAKARMQGSPNLLTPEQAKIFMRVCGDVCERHAIEPLAIAVMPNHVHVLCQTEHHGQTLLQLFKGNASRVLGKEFELQDAPRWWSKSGSRRRIRGGSDLTAAIEYVKSKSSPLLLWSFDVQGGEAHDILTAARAEARGSAPREPEYVIIATTRPETMLGDTAVAVNPDPAGVFDKREADLRKQLKQQSTRSAKDAAVVQKKLDVLLERRESHLALLIQLRDMANDGRKIKLPLMCREIPLISDELADPTLGSGCVKITPAHDPNDYDVWTRHPEIGVINVLTKDGKVADIVELDGSTNERSGEYAGLTFSKEGRAKVVADMESRELVDAIEDHEVELGHSDRSKAPIEPYLSDQWFVKTGDIPPEPHASACAITPSPEAAPVVERAPDLSQGATLLTWTTYGTWLPGDHRGSVSRDLRGSGKQELRNLPGEAYGEHDDARHTSAANRREGSPVYLDKDHAVTVLSRVADTCERHGLELLAVAIMANHVHVLCQGEQHGREILQLLKGNTSHALGKRFDLENAPRWWTKSGSRRRIKAGSDLTAAIEYVQNQSHPLRVWSFDRRDGESVEIVSIARAKARGSGGGGVRLGDGSSAPGLAQAAIDAVEDGRTQIFPSRYAKSYVDWLGEKRDWCISRQLWWGHRIPVWESSLRSRSSIDRKAVVKDSTVTENSEENPEGWPWSECAIQESTDAAVGQHTWHSCPPPDREDVVDAVKKRRNTQDPDVLDTWFSSALWPFSTLGWPEETDHLKQYYPTAVLCTSRDIITNWVARMVMFGLYSMGEVPFRHVYIHPKILDGRGETMSKSKGNGVDPVDIIHTHGADALRYAMADMTTETQDIRMPVDYVCPHCGKMVDQTLALKAEAQARKSRGEKLQHKLQPADCHRVTCVHKECGKEFATRWASEDVQKKLPVAREASDKFDLGRNFCNKLWNAARFAFINLGGATCDKIDLAALPPEDRWILARISQTIRHYHECIEGYQFAASVKLLREFFWESLCDWYIELTKPRLSPEPQASACAVSPDTSSTTPVADPIAKQILAFCLDQTLRLWHPTIPFITERLWAKLNEIAPKRGLLGIADLESGSLLVTAAMPPREGYPTLENEGVLRVFEDIQDVVHGVRELRNSCKVSPKQAVDITVALPDVDRAAFEKNAHIVRNMANVRNLSIGANAKRPKNAGSVTMGSMRIHVHDITDDAVERTRTKKSLAEVEKQIVGKEKKLANENFVANAKPEVVAAERARLAELTAQRAALNTHMAELDD